MSLHQISLLPLYGVGDCTTDADQAFGPLITRACRAFDFTLMFEQTILSIVPSSIFLVSSLWRMYRLNGSALKVAPNYVGAFKAVRFSPKALDEALDNS